MILRGNKIQLICLILETCFGDNPLQDKFWYYYSGAVFGGAKKNEMLARFSLSYEYA